MNKIKNFLFIISIVSFLIMQFFLLKYIIKLYSFDKFFFLVKKIEKIIYISYSFNENFANLTKGSSCVIFKIPSINEKNFILKDYYDYAIMLFHKDNVFFNLQTHRLSFRKPQSFYIKNIKNFNLKYLGNALELSCSINKTFYSYNFFIEKYFIRIPFYDKKVF